MDSETPMSKKCPLTSSSAAQAELLAAWTGAVKQVATCHESLSTAPWTHHSKLLNRPVSGQLQVENFCCGLGDVYTFGPTFRAENSSTTRHLAEFWMIEPEMAFANLEDDMDCAEAYIRYCVSQVLEKCKSDVDFFNLRERLELIASKSFARMSYTEAVEDRLWARPGLAEAHRAR
eukprot:Skav217216  [mRNA]  locus=scaffold143:309351:312612:- [translate_table: standard]